MKLFYPILAAFALLSCDEKPRPVAAPPPPSISYTSDDIDAAAQAVQRGDLEALTKLIDQGVPVESRGRTLLEIPTLTNESPAPRRTVELNEPLLAVAARFGKADIVKYLVSKGAQINAPWKEPATNGLGMSERHSEKGTALNCAVLNGHLDVVKVLVESGADVNSPGDSISSEPPLYRACGFEPIDIAKYLVLKGADVNLISRSGGHTPLIVAIYRMAGPELIAFLLDHGADINKPNRFGQRPVQVALEEISLFDNYDPERSRPVVEKQVLVLQMLIEKGAKLDGLLKALETKFAKTDLHADYVEYRKRIVDLLKQHGARD